MTRRLWLAALALLGACASAPPPAPAPPAGRLLSYALPTPTTASYAFADSTSIDIQGGPIGEIKVKISASGVADVTYALKGSDVEATIRVPQFAGAMTNSAVPGSLSATQTEIEGPAVVVVSARGVPAFTTKPKLSQLIQRVGVSESFFRRFFVRLPADRVQAGAAWVDTVEVTEDNAGMKSSYRDVITSTFTRDTVVNGRTFALIATSSQRTLNISGVNEGVEIVQKLAGTANGTVQWDTDRKLLVDRWERTDLSGTFDLPQMGMTGMPVTARGTGRLSLR